MKKHHLLNIFLFFPFLIFAQSKNLAPNPGYENGTNSWVVRTATIDKSVKHSGQASLKYVNNDPNNYQVIVTHINVKGGETLRFSAWVKGKDITRKDFGAKGAGIYLHAYDENNNSLGGSNPPTPTGTFDWTKVEGLFEVPAKARRIAISLYLVKGNIGTVWFDDVVVEPFQFEQSIKIEPSLGSVAATAVEEYISTKQLSSGTKEALIKAATSKVSGRADAPNEVMLDKEGFTIKDGKRFFPFGLYIGKAEKQGVWDNAEFHLKRIKEAGFNTVLSYVHGDRRDAVNYLDQLDRLGLNSIYSLAYLYDGHQFYTPVNSQRAVQRIPQLVSELKDKPALLAWYTGDEIPLSHLLAAKENYEAIRQVDKRNPVFQVTNKPDLLPKLIAVADVVGTDPYPITRKSQIPNMKMVSNWASQTVSTAGKVKGAWQVVQIFSKLAYNGTLSDDFVDPSVSEMQNMLYQSVIQGAKGILFYSYHDLWFGNDTQGKGVFSKEVYERRWKEVSAISRSFEQIIPIILADEVTQISGLKTPDGVIHKAWNYRGDTYLMIANTDNKEVSITIPGKSNIKLGAHGSDFIKL